MLLHEDEGDAFPVIGEPRLLIIAPYEMRLVVESLSGPESRLAYWPVKCRGRPHHRVSLRAQPRHAESIMISTGRGAMEEAA